MPPNVGRESWHSNNDTWRLLAGDVEVARFVVNDADQPWLIATFHPAPEFDDYKHLFVEELAALEREDFAGLEALWRRIRAQLTFIHPDGRIVAEWLLHIENDQSWWRWSMEPFERSE